MNKKCPQCETIKPLTIEFFHRSSQTKNGFRCWCKTCQKAANRAFNIKNPEKASKRVLRSRNRSAESISRHTKSVIECRNRNPDKYFDTAVSTRLGVPRGWYISQKSAQENKCSICGIDGNSLSRRLSVDHCHLTGKVRELICGECNLGIGKFKDSPALLLSAASYLTRHLPS